MTENTSEILDTYDELERAIYWCIPEDDAAIKAECGGWVVEITPKDRKNYKLRQAFDLATQGLELRYLLDRLRDLDGMRAFNESYYDGGWWKVSIHYKGESSKTLVVDDPRGEIWDAAEALVTLGADYQGVVEDVMSRKVKYSLRKVEKRLKQPSVTVRNKNVITHHEGRAVQVTEFPAMTVITLWKEIEYK